jgi:MurNAc alpha-1-phosphate uridylyltransferase
VQALPLLGEAPFLVVNGDVWTDYPFARLAASTLQADVDAHLVMVGNPPQHPAGDFALDTDNRIKVLAAGTTGWTYSGVGLYSPAFFSGVAPGKLALRPLLDAAIHRGRLVGERYIGEWQDVGTPERLRALDLAASAQA